MADGARTAASRVKAADAMMNQNANEENERQNVATKSGFSTETDNRLVAHGPSKKVKKQIRVAIDRRKEMTKASSRISSFFEHEISGAYEYLDHTADVQIHSWGHDLNQALEQLVVAMFGCMTRLSRVNINEQHSRMFATGIRTQGHDLLSLVFNFLQEWLCVFHDTGFVAKTVTIDEVDWETCAVQSHGLGELADWSKHEQGVEVKAVTYSCLRVEQSAGRCDITVILDI